jgi:7-cyano-7-deazaguanine synthase
MKRALLLSGGMDSLALAWWVRPEIGITLDYGQLAAEAEISASKAICKRLEIQHYVVSIDCRALGSGDMAGAEADARAPASDWWPYRNQMLVTLAAMKAISLGVTTLYLGTVKSDGSHRDGTPEFIGAISRLMALQEGGMTVEAPAIELSTAELVRKAGVPRDMLAWAHSCHKSNVACGRCRGCNKYLEVWGELD